MMSKKSIRKLNLLMILLFIVIFVVGVSYAYTHALVVNNETSTTITATGAILEIIYNDPETGGFSPNINAQGIIPGWQTTKTFTATGRNDSNVGDQDIDTNMYYKIELVIEENTFSEGSLIYKLEKDSSSSSNGSMSVTSGTINNEVGSQKIGNGYFTKSNTKETHKYNLTISFPETGRNQSQDKNKTFKSYVKIGEGDEYANNMVAYIKKLCNGENNCTGADAEDNGLFRDPTVDKNIRYTGATPKNYISFNDELWRIIGIFNVKDSEDSEYKEKIKIVRDETIGDFSWDTSASNVNSGNGYNDWTSSDLKNELNGDYLDTTLTSNTTWYNGQSNQKTGIFNYKYAIKLEYQNMISESVWNIGGNVYSEPSTKPYGLPTLGQYNAERGTLTYNDSRPTMWTGNVGLIYPTDYGYASTDAGCRNNLRNGLKYVNDAIDYSGTTCKNNNYLHNGSHYFTLSPYSGYTSHVFIVSGKGHISPQKAYEVYGVRPSLYLNPNIKIKSGDGTQDNPYTIYL